MIYKAFSGMQAFLPVFQAFFRRAALRGYTQVIHMRYEVNPIPSAARSFLFLVDEPRENGQNYCKISNAPSRKI